MGEEIKEQEEQKEENKQEDVKNEVESNVIKLLRKKYEDSLKRLKELEEENKNLKTVARIANIDELALKVDKLDFENTILKKFPHLANEVEDIWNFRKQGESIEDTVSRYIGKKMLENATNQNMSGFSLGSKTISPNLEEDLSSLPMDKLREIAKEEFKKIYGLE